MGEPTDTDALTADLMTVVRLLARDAVASAMAAGTAPGTKGVTLATRLAEIAAAELADVERVAARIASLGGSPSVTLKKLDPPQEVGAALEWLAAMQREGNDAVVAAIPADADDAEGEASEHLLEHIVARKRDVIELLDRALR
jgi:bacterioferritin (cytochrome b1)